MPKPSFHGEKCASGECCCDWKTILERLNHPIPDDAVRDKQRMRSYLLDATRAGKEGKISSPKSNLLDALRNQNDPLACENARTITDLLSHFITPNSPDEDTLQLCQFARKLVRFWGKECLPRAMFLSGIKIEDPSTPFAHGGFGEIYLASYSHSSKEQRNSTLVVKKIQVTSSMKLEEKRHYEKRFCQEILLWMRLEHSNVIRLLGLSKDGIMKDELPRLVMDKMDQNLNGHLTGNLVANRERLRLVKQIVEGLKYLHDWKMVHGDLKLENILIQNNSSLNEHGPVRAYICDFGMMNTSETTKIITTQMQNHGGTLHYMSIEMLYGRPVEQEDDEAEQDHGVRKRYKGPKITRTTDIWSLAMIMFFAFAKREPFPGIQTQVQLYKKLKRGDRPKIAKPITNGKRLWSLMTHAWRTNPKERPVIIKFQEFFQEATDDEIEGWDKAIEPRGSFKAFFC